MTIDVYGASARPQAQPNVGLDGCPTIGWGGSYEAAALAQNKVVALAKIPKNSEILGLHHFNDALGATNGLTYGFIYEDGTGGSAALFKTVSDASSAAAGIVGVAPFVTTQDAYLTVTKTGAGTATGTIGGKVIFNFLGGN